MSVTPNHFAAVMGTGIVAVALATTPLPLPGATDVALVVWVAAAVVLVALTVAALRRPQSHLDDPVLAHFYGAPAMALLTVGAGALLVGPRVLGDGLALVLASALWVLGTVAGLATAVLVPFRAITVHAVGEDAASATWLMPVVPPMVSAATGAALVPHLPAGQARTTVLLLCYALFGATLLATLLVLPLVWHRLLRFGPGAAAAVPTTWIALGPLGQSVTAAHHLGAVAPDALGAPYGTAFSALALVYGVPVLGAALLWLALAVALTVRTARSGLPFAPTWWSFTFPVGTLATGAGGLAATTGLVALQVLAGVLLAALVAAWAVVATRSVVAVLPQTQRTWRALPSS